MKMLLLTNGVLNKCSESTWSSNTVNQNARVLNSCLHHCYENLQMAFFILVLIFSTYWSLLLCFEMFIKRLKGTAFHGQYSLTQKKFFLLFSFLFFFSEVCCFTNEHSWQYCLCSQFISLVNRCTAINKPLTCPGSFFWFRVKIPRYAQGICFAV